MKRNITTRVIETGRMVRGSSGQGVGWLQSLSDRLRNVRAQVQGVMDRLNTPLSDGPPDCVAGELTFKADTNRIITITNFPTDPDSAPEVVIANLKVNPIILAGETYRIPIVFPPPGLHRARNLVVGIEAGYTMFANQNRPGLTPLNDYRQYIDGSDVSGGFVSALSSKTIKYTYQMQVLGDFMRVQPFVPFLWNIIDEKSQRPYAKDWIPHGVLMNTRGWASGPSLSEGHNLVNPDGELFEFDGDGYLFERDAQVSFLFRPLVDLYQVDASDAQMPYGGVDDRTGGQRFERATVRVEFHGNRYYESQDVLKDGAYVTDGPEPPRTGQGYGDRTGQRDRR